MRGQAFLDSDDARASLFGVETNAERTSKIALIQRLLEVAFPNRGVRHFYEPTTMNEVFAIEDEHGQEQCLLATHRLLRDIDSAGIEAKLANAIRLLHQGDTEVFLRAGG